MVSRYIIGTLFCLLLYHACYTSTTGVLLHVSYNMHVIDCNVPVTCATFCIGKEQRLIVLHAGGIERWVEGADLVFRSKTNSANYHDEMNHEHYIEWLTEQMLLNLQDNSVIVLDDATCTTTN